MTQISVTPTWIQIFSALLTPLIALITVSILVLQYRLTKQRWRLDLYDKRYPIFLTTMEYLGFIARDRKITVEDLNKFLRNSRDKEFLFGNDVQQFHNELYNKGVEFKKYISIVNSRTLPDEEHRKLVEKEAELFEWFLKQFDASRALFIKYLAIDNK